jgi:aminomethyltransferase
MNSLNPKKTALYEVHRQAGGRIVEFAGWLMPVQFSSIIDEHLAVRNSVGLFDVSHMGEIDFRGKGALAAVQKLVCNDAAVLANGQVMYSGLMTDKGTFVDDVLVHKMADDHYMFCVNASNTDKDYAWIMNHLEPNVQCLNISDTICQIAVQGPKSIHTLAPFVKIPLKEIKYYHFVHNTVAGHPAMISRTGYTGERGFEIYVENQYGVDIWNKLMQSGAEFGVKPIGLGARDTLRLEAAMPLYGNDIDDTVTPFEAGLDWIVKLEKGDFIGRDPLVQQKQRGIQRKLVGLELIDRGVPRHGYPILKNAQPIGVVTSGTMAPFLKLPIAMGFVPLALAEVGTRVDIDIRNKPVQAKVVQLPFYQKKTKASAG